MIEITEIVQQVNITVEETTNTVNLEVTPIVQTVNIEVAEMGMQGLNGKSAYQIAVENGFVGTEEQWIESLRVIIFENLTELP